MPKANHQIILVQSHPSRTEKVMEQCPKFQKNLFYYKEKRPGQWVIFQSDTRTRSLQVHYLTALNRQMCHQQDSLWVTSGEWRVCPKRQLSSLVSCQVFRSQVEKPLLEKEELKAACAEVRSPQVCELCLLLLDVKWDTDRETAELGKFHEQHIPNTISKPS